MGQTDGHIDRDGSRYRLIPPYGGSIITVTEDGMVGLYLIAISTNNLQLRDLVVSFLAYCTTLLYYLAIQPFKAASVFK